MSKALADLPVHKILLPVRFNECYFTITIILHFRPVDHTTSSVNKENMYRFIYYFNTIINTLLWFSENGETLNRDDGKKMA